VPLAKVRGFRPGLRLLQDPDDLLLAEATSRRGG
jgi:hypothetical protein